MSDVIIKYNDKGVPVTGTGPTPYVSLSDQVLTYGDKWGLAHSISLNGVISGCSYEDLYDAQTGLVGVFDESYKTLQVFESEDGQNNYSEVFSFSGCSIDNISFSNSSYNRVVNYSVELSSFPSGFTGFFTDTYGVLDPIDRISISEQNDGFATLNRQIAARGFVTTTIDDAINNAKNYVQSRTGISNVLSFNQISGFENGSFTPVLIANSESLDRLSLTYSIEQNYRFPIVTGDTEAYGNYSFNNYYITNYSTDLNSGAGQDFVQADINGSITAGLTGLEGDALTGALIEKLSELNPYGVISGKYGDPNGFTFCTDPITFNVSQDLANKTLNFNASYDNLDFYSYVDNKYVYGGTYWDASVNHNINELTKVTEILLRGEIKSRGSVKTRYNKNLAYLGELLSQTDAVNNTTQPRVFDFANDYYIGYFGATPKFALNEKPSSLTVDANPNLGTIFLSAKFDNKDRFGGLSATEFNISYVPYNTLYSYDFSCNDSLTHLAVDVDVTRREKASINLSLSDTDTVEKNLVTGVYNFASGDFYNDFILTLGEAEGVQEEDSTLSVGNTSYSDNATSETKYNSTASLNQSFSYKLKPSIKVNRRIIKSN